MLKWQCSSEVVFHYRNRKYNVLACRNSGKINFVSPSKELLPLGLLGTLFSLFTEQKMRRVCLLIPVAQM